VHHQQHFCSVLYYGWVAKAYPTCTVADSTIPYWIYITVEQVLVSFFLALVGRRKRRERKRQQNNIFVLQSSFESTTLPITSAWSKFEAHRPSLLRGYWLLLISKSTPVGYVYYFICWFYLIIVNQLNNKHGFVVIRVFLFIFSLPTTNHRRTWCDDYEKFPTCSATIPMWNPTLLILQASRPWHLVWWTIFWITGTRKFDFIPCCAVWNCLPWYVVRTDTRKYIYLFKTTCSKPVLVFGVSLSPSIHVSMYFYWTL